MTTKGTHRVVRWFNFAKLTGWVLMLAYFPVSFFFVSHAKSEIRCQAIKPDVHSDGDNVLITSSDLLNIVKSKHPEMVGTLLADIDYATLEKEVESLPAVRRCEAYPTVGGSIHVNIYQRHPIMRVFASGGSYYMDEEGYKVTATRAMRSHTLVVNGHVNSMLSHEDLIALCHYINDDPFWKAMIEQVYVTRRHEFVLVPRVGNHIVEFGGIEDMKRKFNDLSILYRSGWDKHEWNVYKKVSLKYSGQIVCTRR